MKTGYKLGFKILGITVLAAAAGFIAHPKGQKINLESLKIRFNKEFPVKLGLDLQGGSHLIYQAKLGGVAAGDRAEALESAKSVLERRVNSFGLSEPQVFVQGSDKIVVELPGAKDVKDAVDKLGATPLLEFKIQNPNPTEIKPDADGKVNIDGSQQWQNTQLSGKQLKRATADLQTGSGQIGGEVVVRLEFDDEGKKLFGEITAANVGKPIAIFLDNQILSAPNVREAITDGVAVISGGFNAQTAKELATRLNAGALPVPVELVSQSTIGASLGKDSITSSLVAGIIGIFLVALFMLLYYRFPGLLAVVALAFYIALSLAVFKLGLSPLAVVVVGGGLVLGLTTSVWFGLAAILAYGLLLLLGGLSPVTLTLAGIAGFVLSVGMAVDANILIFERLKEELRAGKPFEKAVEDGFGRAWASIRDSNVSSLITTAILYSFGTPSIRGFAVTLAIGIVLSMFTAISVTKTLLQAFTKISWFRHNWMYGVSKKVDSL